jgi:hypothetical protein
MKATVPAARSIESCERNAPSAERAAALGSRLRQIFDEAAAEPMPQAFEDLLRKLS